MPSSIQTKCASNSSGSKKDSKPFGDLFDNKGDKKPFGGDGDGIGVLGIGK